VTINSALSDGQVGNPYSRSVFASGGLQPYTFSVTAGALPPGLQLDPRGIVLGVPETTGSYTFTLTVADNNVSFGPVTASRTYTVRIEPSGFVFGPETLPNARTDEAYQQGFSALYGMPPFDYAISAGALPPGLSLFAGMLYGTPTEAGSYAFSITGSDSSPDGPSSYTRDYVLVVELSAIEINPLEFPDATAGQHYRYALSARGGARPYRYSLATGALPPGLSLSEEGTISGIPTSAGHFNFNVLVADSASGTASTATRDFSLAVALPEVRIFTDRLQPAAVGSNYMMVMITYGGQAPYTYALTAGILPAGLELTANGYLRGTPEVVGSFEITITASDSSAPFGPVSGSRSYTLVVESRRLSFDPGFLPGAAEGAPYFVTLQGLNGVAPYRFSITNGALPPGLSLASDGTISGVAGSPLGSAGFYQYQFALSIVDANGVSATFPYVEILLARRSVGMLPATVPAGIAGVTIYRQQFTAVSATASHVFSWESGNLPKGLHFDPATATLSGIPLETGSFQFQLRLIDAENRFVVNSYVLDIASPTLTLAPGTLPDGVAGTAYTQTFVATGGVAPYVYAVEARNDGRLPPGLSLGADGVLQGTSTSVGVFTFAVVATDATGGQAASAVSTYTLTIATPSIIVDPDTQPKAIGGLDYAQTFTARGGTAPYTFSITAGALSPGLALTAQGVLSGKPTGAGDSTFTVTATDALGFTGARTYTIAVAETKPVPMSRIYAVVAGDALALDITEGASGGPFTAAALVSLSPSHAGTAKIVPAGGSYRLEFIPGPTFSGRATATFTLSNALATSAPATVVFDVAPRPDPSGDAEARRLLDAQTQAAQRFASAQIGNFQQRMERMHGAGEGRGFANGLGAMAQEYCPQQVGSLPGRRCERRAGETGAGAMPPARGKDSNAAFGVWASGMIRSGNQDGRNGDANVDFETDGVSVGADYRFNEAFAFGGGLGYGRDESEIGDNGSRSESDAFTLALYASYSPGERWFVDALLGYQSLGFDLRRYATANSSVFDGSRDGTQWFGSVSTGADIQRGPWQFTPYARLDVAQATLDGYAESGDPLYALAYDALDVETTTGNVGLRIDYRREVSWGMFSPQFRVEYQHDFKGNGAQTLRYADLPTGPFYRAELSDFDRSRLMLGLGLLFSLDNDWSFKLDYRGLIGSGDDTDHGFQINVDRKF
jgi:outer membrane autotransporter protein